MTTEMIINEYNNNMEIHKRAKEDLKAQYLSIIHNKNIDLDIRWKTFIEAPHEFKKHELYGPYFVVIDQITNFSWYDDMSLDRHQTMDSKNLISRIEESLVTHKSGYATSLSKHFISNPELILELKEEILEQNMGSFTYDW